MNMYVYVCIEYREREEKGVELQRQWQILDKDLGI